MGIFHELKLGKAGAAVKFAFKESQFYKSHKDDDWAELSSFPDEILEKGDISDERIAGIFTSVENRVTQMSLYADKYPYDGKFRSGVNEFLDIALQSKPIRKITSGFGVEGISLRLIFLSALLGTMPYPFYKAGCAMLTPVGIFQEDGKLLYRVLKMLSNLVNGQPREKHVLFIPIPAIIFGQEIKRQHDEAYGMATI
jgi:hypothetical protein